jgi:hypothetical protein
MLKGFIGFASAILLGAATVAAQVNSAPHYQSPFMRIDLAPDQPAFTTFTLDSLGKGKLSVNPLRAPGPAKQRYQLRSSGTTFEYRPVGTKTSSPAAWSFEFSPKHVRIKSIFAGQNIAPLFFSFDPFFNHATLLGHINPDSSVRLPALLHLPDLGTMRITAASAGPLALGYDAQRLHGRGAPPENPANWVHITFPAATAGRRAVTYDLQVVDIYPQAAGIENDQRFDGFRRNWLNMFQLQPRDRVLENNIVSGACPCSLYMYSSIAERTPPLAPGLTALDLIRETLDRYLDGFRGIGMQGYDNSASPGFMDSYPSLLIAATDYARASKDQAWLERNYEGLRHWAALMLAQDTDGDGLIEYLESGDSNSWPAHRELRPANWWDTIGFGNKDAFSNVLVYRALEGMTEAARSAGQPGDAKMYAERAEKLKSVYFKTFYDPETGVLAGWKSADGQLHDYYFTFLNSMAISWGLIPRDQADSIMDHLLAKLKAVGYTRFDLGLPGNLIPVRRSDYVVLDHRSGGSQNADGSDGFQIYENGGASGNYLYYTLQALYSLGRRKEADAILFPLLEGYERGGFQGFGPNNMSYDWKTWEGVPWGYEGLLVDNYQALLAVLARQ